MADVSSIQFVKKLQECVRDYKKQMLDTRDEKDAAHYFNASLKTFIKTHKEEFDVLSSLNFEKPFMSWVKNYLLSS